MKKLLLGSTALLGAIALSGAASAQQVVTKAPFTLTIGGSFSSYFGVNAGGDEGLAGTAANGKKNYDFLSETLLQFAASAKTDNGLTYGATVRKYFNTGGNQGQTGGGFSAFQGTSTTDYDRSWVFLQGSFGRIDFGDVNSTRATFMTTALNSVGPVWGNGLGPDGGMAAFFYNVQGTSISGAITSPGNYTTFGGNSTTRRTKLVYTSPSFEGFQAGLSYMPSAGDSGANFDRTDTLVNGASTTAINGRANYRDVIEGGLRYKTTISGVTVTPALGFLFASGYKTLTSSQATLEDANSVFAGIQFDYQGASLGVGYTNSFKSGLAKNNLGTAPNRDSTEGMVVALGYVTGPWALSGFYQYVTMEGSQAATASGNDTARLFEIAGGYTLAPGLQLWTAVHNYEFKDENVTKRNGTLFLLGTSVSF
ncbi:MAG: porin [Elsteraceae bacterium]